MGPLYKLSILRNPTFFLLRESFTEVFILIKLSVLTFKSPISTEVYFMFVSRQWERDTERNRTKKRDAVETGGVINGRSKVLLTVVVYPLY